MNAIIFVKAREQDRKQAQIDACHEYAVNNDMKVAGVYDDLEKMFNRIEQNDIQKIIITERSRLTRNTLEYYLYLIKFREMEIKLISLNEQ